METYSGHSGSCINEEERKQMSWADQVDLAYPLEECWSESCLTEPHFCMEDHQMPEVRSGEEKLEDVVCQDQALDHWDTCDLREVDTTLLECCSDDKSVVSLDQTRVYGDPFALPLMDWDPAVCVDPFALRAFQEDGEHSRPGPGLQGPLCPQECELERYEGMTTSCPPHTTLAFPHATFLDLRPPGQDYCYIHTAQISWPLRREA